MNLSLTNILVIGQSGQISPVLTSYLCQNKSLRVTTVSRLSYSSTDFCQHYSVVSYSFKAISKIIDVVNPDCIIYCLAAGSVKARADSHETIKYINSTLPTMIWSLCNRAPHPVKFVYFSSTAIYKGLKSGSKVNLLTDASPACDYSYYKAICHENIISSADSFSNAYSYQLILASVFGGPEHPSRLIPRIISYFQNHTSFSLYLSHDSRDYISVFDICLAVESLLVKSPSTKSTNILAVSGVRYTNSDIFDYLKQLLDSDLLPKKISISPAYYGDSINYDSSSFSLALGRPPVSVSNGFSRDILHFYSV